MVNQVIVGRYIGITFKQNAKLYTKKVLHRSLGIALVTSFILALSGSFIIEMFTEDPTYSAYGFNIDMVEYITRTRSNGQ